MSFNRIAFGIAVLIAVAFYNPDPGAVFALVVYCIGSTLVFLQILFDSAARPVRRLAVMAVDFIILSYALHANGAYAAAFWPIYLWVVFGNGFRFGLSYLFASAGTAIFTFAAVIATTPYWSNMMGLSIGLMLSLIALPAYAGQLIKKLSTAKREAEEASRAKSYFLASVSHELRTPLTAVIGLGAHLQEMDLSPDQRGMAGTIVTAGRSLLALINQLLEYSRLGANGIAAKAKPFDLLQLILSVREMMEITAGEKGLKIGFHVDASTPLSLNGDEEHLRDILVNLVGNAIKFTERGTITICASAEETGEGAYMLRLAVQDTGIGIAADAVEHIFDSFRQADNTIIDRFGGTGLGLAICKQLAELLGGAIGVESVPGEGSLFWFTAPVAVAEEEVSSIAATDGKFFLLTSDEELSGRFAAALQDCEIQLVTACSLHALRAMIEQADPSCCALLIDSAESEKCGLSPDEMAQWLGSRISAILVSDESWRPMGEQFFVGTLGRDADMMELTRALKIGTAARNRLLELAAPKPSPAEHRSLRVLVADDNVMNQKVFGMILRNAGHIVETARDGEAALDVLRDQPVDVVLMDVNMPVLNGIETTKLYRFASLGRKRVPIIGITADASPETTERCLDAGMDACLSKPIDAAELLKILDEVPGEPSEIILSHDPDGVVTPLFPREPVEAPAGKPALNWAKLEDLEELGGREFVTDLLNDYIVDAISLLDALGGSVEIGNIQGFRDGAHAFRSSAANIGADRLADLCMHLQHIGSDEFAAKAAQHLATLKTEIECVREALDLSSAKGFSAAGRGAA
jgi:two-component system sensor histidine kinase RpfC